MDPASPPLRDPSLILGLPDLESSNQYLWDHPQTVLAAVHFNVTSDKVLRVEVAGRSGQEH